SENVHNGNARRLGILPRHERMRDHYVSILVDELDIDGFVRVRLGGFLHGEQQGLAVALEGLILMNEVGSHELLVSGSDISAACHFQEGSCGFFVGHWISPSTFCPGQDTTRLNRGVPPRSRRCRSFSSSSSLRMRVWRLRGRGP